METMWEYNPMSVMQPTEITPRIRNILQQYAWPERGLTIQEYISRGKGRFFNFTFPWYASDKTGLEDFKTLFLSKYWLYQIGQETEELFKLQLQVRLMEKMPYWEQVYKSTIMKYDPLINRLNQKNVNSTENGTNNSTVDNTKKENDNITTTDQTTLGIKGTTSNTRVASSQTTQDSQSIGSDNPQVTVNTEDYASTMNRGKLQDVGTANDTDNGTSSQTNTGTSSGSNITKRDSTGNQREQKTYGNTKTESYTESGFIGDSQTDNILKFREAIVNLNSEILEYLKPCFLFSIN